jgi:hypothetical protein
MCEQASCDELFGMRLLLLSFAFLNVAAALAPSHGTALSRLRQASPRRSSNLCGQLGLAWVSEVDPQSGKLYYYNQETGVSQWEPPTQGYTGPVMWRLIPAWGVYSEYDVGMGEETVLSRFDMMEEKNTVSRMQCVVEVLADGTAYVSSLGKRPTGLRARATQDHRGLHAPWYGLLSDPTRMNAHLLKDGEQIALDMDSGESFGWQGSPYSAVFTCQMVRLDEQGQHEQGQHEQYGQQYGGQQQYGHQQQYGNEQG